jgi:hypothetical protein
MIVNNYKFSQQELYTIAETATNSLEEHLAAFSNLKGKYDASYVAAVRAEIQTAKNLPDDQSRSVAAEVARIELVALNNSALNIFQTLKRYIVDAFPPNKHKTQFEGAGQQYYAKASQENWDATQGLLTSGLNYIIQNTVELTADQNMPVTFQNDFTEVKTNFEARHQVFFQAEEVSRVQTQTKIMANNALYDKVVNFCQDGQDIFRKDEATRKQFIIADLLLLASGAGVAGFKGKVTNAITEQVIEDVLVTIQYTDKVSTTNKEGRYAITQVAAGSYQVVVTKNGFSTQIITQQVKTGTVSTLNIQLLPEA